MKSLQAEVRRNVVKDQLCCRFDAGQILSRAAAALSNAIVYIAKSTAAVGAFPHGKLLSLGYTTARVIVSLCVHGFLLHDEEIQCCILVLTAATSKYIA